MSSGIDIKAIFDFSHCGSKHHTNDHAYKSALCLNCQMLKGTPRFVRRGTWLKVNCASSQFNLRKQNMQTTASHLPKFCLNTTVFLLTT